MIRVCNWGVTTQNENERKQNEFSANISLASTSVGHKLVIVSTLPAIYTPTNSPSTTPTRSPYKNIVGTDVYIVRYSYYYPDLLGVNCNSGNIVSGHCADTTSSGLPWTKYLGKGVALAPSMLVRIPYGSIIHVLSPNSIMGDYTVIDMCMQCEPTFWAPDYQYRIDFLDTVQRLDWATILTFEVVTSH